MSRMSAWVFVILFSLATVFARLAILGQIYNLTLVKNLNTPAVTMWQMFAVSWFLVAVTHSPDVSNKDKGEDALVTILTKDISSVLGLLVSWGLAALVF